MQRKRPALFRGRHFEDTIIILCVRWYLRYSLSYRDLEEMMMERGLTVDHVTIWRWVQRYAPILNQRCRRRNRRSRWEWTRARWPNGSPSCLVLDEARILRRDVIRGRGQSSLVP